MNADIHDAFLAADDWSRRDYPDPAEFAGEAPRAAAAPSAPQHDAPPAKPPRRTRPRRAATAAPLASRR